MLQHELFLDVCLVLFAVLPVLQAEETEQSTGLLVDVAI